jgi:hypothetical protein
MITTTKTTKERKEEEEACLRTPFPFLDQPTIIYRIVKVKVSLTLKMAIFIL